MPLCRDDGYKTKRDNSEKFKLSGNEIDVSVVIYERDF